MIEVRIDTSELRELYALIGRNIAGSPVPPAQPQAGAPAQPQVGVPAQPPSRVAPPDAPDAPQALPPDLRETADGRSGDTPSPALTLAGLRPPLPLAASDLALLRQATALWEADDAPPKPVEASRDERTRADERTHADERRRAVRQEAPSLAGVRAEPRMAASGPQGTAPRAIAFPATDATPAVPQAWVEGAAATPDAADAARGEPALFNAAQTGRVVALPVSGSAAHLPGFAGAAILDAGSPAREPERREAAPVPSRAPDIETAPAPGRAHDAFSSAAVARAEGDLAAPASAVALRASTDLLEDIGGFLARAGLGEAAEGSRQVERAGVIASFILNAAMIPGWPPPRPIEPASFARAVPVPAAMPTLEPDEMEAGLLLLRMLRDPAKVAALLAALATQRRRRKILALLALLATQVRTLIDLWAAELGALPTPEPAAPRRERLVLR